MKTCTKCKTEKQSTEFNTDRSRETGLTPWCKLCQSIAWKKRYREGYKKVHLKKVWLGGDKKRIREYNKRKFKKHSFKIKAQAKLRYAIKTGKIKRLPCEVCGIKKSHGHHENYNKPYDVKWLCDNHHKEVHNRLIRPIRRRKHEKK